MAWVGDKLQLISHKIFTPYEGETLNVEATAEAAVMDLHRRFYVRAVNFDPWQGIALAQKLTKVGVHMLEYPQTSSNLAIMAGSLLDLIKAGRLVV